jgi:hypothetical protein
MKFDYSDIASKIYSRSFNVISVFIFVCLLIAYLNSDDIIEIMKIVLEFVKYIIAVYVIPVSLQIGGEYVKIIMNTIKRGKNES